MANTGGFGSVPKIEVVKKEILYRSRIHFTPLINDEQIDAEEVLKIVLEEYMAAGYTPRDIDTGAVIITGETARKRNAKAVLSSLSEIAGDFVVASAGPVLESVLSGKGAGAAELSKSMTGIVANIDIGGGTTNFSFFKNGEVVATDCINIGGRLIKTDGERITYISSVLVPMLVGHSVDLKIGDSLLEPTISKLKELCLLMVKEIAKHCNALDGEIVPDVITFSGGVANCMKHPLTDFAYGDIGMLLAKTLNCCKDFDSYRIQEAVETVSATVVGAGNYSMEISGSTIMNQKGRFPMKNIPVYSLKLDCIEDIAELGKSIAELKRRQQETAMETEAWESKDARSMHNHYAVTFSAKNISSFSNIEQVANTLVESYQKEIDADGIPIIIVQNDLAKVLGQALRRRIGRKKCLVCLDSISCEEGDFIDIGEPLANRQVIPVVVKSLIFENR